MTLSADVLREIDAFVRGGFESSERIIEILSEEMYKPSELDAAEIEAAVSFAIATLEEEKKTWPRTTDCDRLNIAFAALPAKGIVALQNAGYTQSDGYEDIMEAFESHANQSSVVGYCYYHGQDLERAISGSGLFLSFEPMNASKEETEGLRVGKLIVEEFERFFKVEWSGKFNQRIFIPDIDWKRRRNL